MSIAAALCFNFFFLPPIGKLTIADTQNWVALFAFFFAAVIASKLSDRARRETKEALRRRRDVERLYVFSQQLMVTENVLELLKTVPHYIVTTFASTHAAIYLPMRDQIYRSDPDIQGIPAEDLREAYSRGELKIDPVRRLAVAPLRMGVRTVGALGIAGDIPSRETLEAVGSLVATAIERARAVDKLTHTEASQESERLRSALLDSVTHEFRTPLTAIKASISTLLTSEGKLTADAKQDLLSVIDEETDRLNRLVGEATEMARLDAQEVELSIEPRS